MVRITLPLIGSPPYTWGAHPVTIEPNGIVGITPIYMGSTINKVFDQDRSEDHPHIHGEHCFIATRLNLYTGITPIYMGSTLCFIRSRWIKEDHPHIHGEHSLLHPCFIPFSGSPPYTWGARFLAVNVCSIIGITPIYMGSTRHQ